MSSFVTEPTRPNRLIPAKEKGKDYHLKHGRWILNSINSDKHKLFQIKSIVNWNFYKGNQWIFDEDLEAFLMDESGDVKNRIKFVENLVRPMVEQYVGTAINMDFNAKAMSISEGASTRREQELNNVKFWAKAAQDVGGSFAEHIKKKNPLVGETQEETEENFNTFYYDRYERAINRLIKFIWENNELDTLKPELAKFLALNGIAILKGYEQNGHQKWDVIDPMRFIFDPTAKKPDLSDSQYWGEYHNHLATELYERFQPKNKEDIQILEDYANNPTQFGTTSGEYFDVIGVEQGRVPIFELCWRDSDLHEYGWVIDQFGYEFYTRVDDPEGMYTMNDVIIPKDKKKWERMGKKKTKRIYVDLIRYVVFCPSELVGSGKEKGDIVLGYGELPYQDRNMLDISNVEPPYKIRTWAYHHGEILSPIEDVISPQRFLNRVLSVAEQQVNNSRGSGTIFDKHMIDAQGGEAEIQKNINQGKPLFVNAKGNMSNSVGTYDMTMGKSADALFGIVSQMRGIIQNVSGVNEAMTGTQGGKREAVGVTSAMINRGTIMQEPFYFAISDLLLKASQSMARQGKQIYAESKRRLSTVVGDEYVQDIVITKGMLSEEFRTFIKRTAPDDEIRIYNQQTLLQLLANQIIDQDAFQKFYGGSEVDDIQAAVRETYNRKMLMERQMAKAQAAQEAQLGQEAQTEAKAQGDYEAMAADIQRKNEIEDRDHKAQSQVDTVAAKALAKMEENRQKNRPLL